MHKNYGLVLIFSTTFIASLSAGAAENENKIPDEFLAILVKAEQFELFSLNPHRPPEEKLVDPFHGWKVLGKTTVKVVETRKILIESFKKGVEENKGMVANCFNPRHGIRVAHDNKVVDFVICFECYQVQVYTGDKKEKGFLITDAPQSTFNKVLEDAKVPLPEQPKASESEPKK